MPKLPRVCPHGLDNGVHFNLRQIGLALNAYQMNNRNYPSTEYATLRIPVWPYLLGCNNFSPLTQILPYLDQPSLYDAANLAICPRHSIHENQTAMLVAVDSFLCPSDAAQAVEGYGRANYRFNIGQTAAAWPAVDLPKSLTGPFSDQANYDPADIRDGLSQTIGVSERLQGDWTKVIFRAGDYLIVDQPRVRAPSISRSRSRARFPITNRPG